MSKRASYRAHHIVYKTTCLVTGRYYIGLHSTDNLNDGYLGSGRRIVSSLKKHGLAQHVRVVLESLPSRMEASARESALITPEMLKDRMCMNCGPGGLGATDRPATKEETRAKLSIASKRFVRTKEHYEKVVAARKANGTNKHTTETKQKMSEIFAGRVLTEEHKKAISEGGKGHEVSEETRKKIGDANRGVSRKQPPKSDEHRQKLREAQLGRKYSNESRALMSAKAKTRCARQKLLKESK